MSSPIRRYSNYDDAAREVLSRAAKLAEEIGRPSLGLDMLARGLLEVTPDMAAGLAERGLDMNALEAIDAASPAARGVTRGIRAALDTAETEASLHGRRTVIVDDLAAGLLAVQRQGQAPAAPR